MLIYGFGLLLFPLLILEAGGRKFPSLFGLEGGGSGMAVGGGRKRILVNGWFTIYFDYSTVLVRRVFQKCTIFN